jgi:hypothetical protein
MMAHNNKHQELSASTQNTMPETDKAVISIRECIENLKQLFKENSISLKKTQRKVSILKEKPNKEMEAIKKQTKILELKNTCGKIKNMLESINRIDQTEERITKLEGRLFKLQLEEKNE